MKVCLYLEFQNVSLARKSGFYSAFRNHWKALQCAGVEVTNDPKTDSYDILHLHGYGPRSLFYLKRAKRRGKPVIIHAHSIGAYDLVGSFNFSNTIAPYYQRILHWYYAHADIIITPSPRARELLEKAGLRKKIEVVPNCVDTTYFSFSPEQRESFRRELGLHRFTVVCAGNVIPRKGVIDFITVAETLPDLDFVWYGQKWSRMLSFYPAMEKKIRSAPPNVRFPGFIENMPAALSAGDIFFFPTLGETQSIALLEAAACELPLVVRDLPEFWAWLKHGYNCLKANSIWSFRKAIQQVIDDARLRTQLSIEARKLALKYDLFEVAQRYLEIYNILLRRL